MLSRVWKAGAWGTESVGTWLGCQVQAQVQTLHPPASGKDSPAPRTTVSTGRMAGAGWLCSQNAGLARAHKSPLVLCLAESGARRQESIVGVVPQFSAITLVLRAGSRQADHSWPRGGGTGGPSPAGSGWRLSGADSAPGARQGPERTGPAAFFSWNFLLAARCL